MKPNKFRYRPKTGEGGESETSTLHRGRHFSFLSVETRFGKKEVLARNNKNYFACKILPLVIDDNAVLELQPGQKRMRVEEFAKHFSAHNLGTVARVPIFSVARPVAYFVKNQFSTEDVYELPGGVVGQNEDFELGGIRELVEELGIKEDQILAHAVLLPPSPFDAGSHVEFMAIIVALLRGKIDPVQWESIRGEKTEMISFGGLQRFLEKSRAEKKIIEGYIEFSYLLFKKFL